MKVAVKLFAAVSGICLLLSCDGNPLAYQKDAHGRGQAKIYFEESFKPLFETSIYTFEGLYPKADIVPEYCTEEAAITAFFKNETKTICITRDFTEEEKARLSKSNVEVRSDKIAEDAVVLIVHPDNQDTTMTVDKLKRILTGKDTLWNTSKSKINVVFDNVNSANFQYLRNLADSKAIPKNIFAVKSNEEVIKYVKENRNAIGVIGANWISDEDDETVLEFLKGIKVVAIAASENSEYFQPYQAYIHTKEYPLTRDLWMINKGSRSGLNTGFVLFMKGEKGQLIIQKSSLVPANTPVRLIQVKTE